MATVKTGVINVSGLTVTAKGTKAVQIKSSGGINLAMTTVEDTDKVKLVAKKKANYILEDFKQLFTGDRTSVSLFGSAATGFDATAYDKYSDVKVINATAAPNAVSLTGNDNASQLIAGTKGSTLSGGKGNDTLTGGKGADLFVYSAGKDLIKGFTASSDTIQINDVAVADASVSGKNLVLKVDDKNTLTVEGMSSKDLTFTDSDGAKSLKGGILYQGTTKAIVSNLFNKTAKTTVNAKTIDASVVTKAVNLSGNSSANSILGGAKNDTLYGAAGKDSINGGKGNDYLYGEAGNDVLYGAEGNDVLDGGAGKDKLYGDAGNDTLIGGAGNDSLWGGDGKDTFIYSSGNGKDVIFGFANDDLLEISGDWTATYNASKNTIAFKVGSTASAITLKDFTATTFNVNSTSYRISNNEFVKR